MNEYVIKLVIINTCLIIFKFLIEPVSFIYVIVDRKRVCNNVTM